MAGAADAQVLIEAVLKDSVTGALNDLENNAKTAGENAEGHISNRVGGAVKLLGGLAISAGAALVTMLGDGVAGAMEAEAAMAQLDAVIASTGNAAGVSKDSLKALADQVQLTTKFTAEQVTATQSMLLTFTNIGASGGIFDQATQAALDMAAALGGEASDKAIMLGKALNDPAAGITALTRVGVTFSDSQKEVIKQMAETGDVAGAQKLILQELQKEFGGSAEAAGKTMAGQLAIAKNAFGEVTEELGVRLLPILTEVLKWVVANMPAIQAGIGKAMDAVGTAFTAAKSVVNSMSEAFRLVANAVGNVIDAINGIASGIKGAVDSARTATESVWSAIKGVFVNAVTFFTDKGSDIVESITDGINKAVNGAKGAVKAITTVWGSIKGVFNNVGSFFLGIGKAIIEGIWDGALGVKQWLADKFKQFTSWLPQWVKDALGIASPSKVFAEIGKFIVQGLAVGIDGEAPVALAAVGRLADAAIEAISKINNGNILAGIQGLVFGIANVFRAGTSPVLKAVGGFLGAIGSAIQGWMLAGPLGALLGFISGAISWVVSLFGGKPAESPPVPEVPATPDVTIPEIEPPRWEPPQQAGGNGVSLGGIGIQSAVATPIVEGARVIRDAGASFQGSVNAFGTTVARADAMYSRVEAMFARLEQAAANGTAGLRYA